jgi:transcriptional regulator GlxA family with amidase domain
VQVAFLLYDGFTALDVTGPLDVLGRLAGAEPVFVAERAGAIRNESRTMAIVADRALSEVPAPDVVVVPGGFGTRLLLEHGPLLSWLAAVHETTTWTTAVCTGSLLLAAAGLLEGTPATTHWLAREQLASLGAQVVNERVVRQGRIVTAAGVSAGIDMALRLVQLMQGDEAAQAIQLAIEYDPEPPFDSGAPEKAPRAIVDAVTTAVRAREAELVASGSA